MTTAMDADLIETVARECLANKVRLLNRAVTAVYDEALRPHGVTIGQMIVLVTVARLDGTSPGVVGRTLHMEKSTLSRTVDRMRSRGWLATDPAADSRGTTLRVTARGRRLLRETVPAWRTAQERAGAMLGTHGIGGIARSTASIAKSRRSRP